MLLNILQLSYLDLSMAFLPVGIVLLLMWRWNSEFKSSSYAVLRMLIQLMLIGYALAYIFKTDQSWVVLIVLSVMLFSASWIALRTIDVSKKFLYSRAFVSILIGGGSVLILITQLVLDLETWYMPSYVIPLGGMIFANSMNSVSLAVERMQSEMSNHGDYLIARNASLKAAMIPITNALFAVGLVSLPGMMTGQILSGVSPFIAARYQIMVMCMIFSSCGLSAIVFLLLLKARPELIQIKTPQ